MQRSLNPLCAALVLAFPSLVLAQAGSDVSTLKAVTVKAEKEEAYSVKSTSAGTRTDTPLAHVPQSVIVVPRSLLEDQDSRTVSDALRNVSNVNVLDPRDTNITTFKVRGFNSSVVVDGVAMPGYFANAESLVNVERIDVVKGPAGGLFGTGQGIGNYGSQGGIIALTTSEPESVARRSVGVRWGTRGEQGLNFDLNQPLNADWAFRLSGEVQRSDSESNGVYFKQNALLPSLAWTPDGATKVVLRLRHLDNRTLDYSGLPTDGTVKAAAYTLPRSLNITASGLPETRQTSDGTNLQWSQKLNDQWNFSLVAAHNKVMLDERGVDWTALGGSAYALTGLRLWDSWTSTTLSPSLTGKFDLNGVRHTVSTGIDYEKTRDDAYMTWSDATGNFNVLGMVDLTAPAFPAWVEPVAPGTPDQQNRYVSKAVYLQDQIDAGPWHLLGSLRHSRIDITDVNNNFMFGQNNVSQNSKTTPRVGAVYDFSPTVSAFAGYSEGMKVPTGSRFATPPKPETSVQKELGLRLNDVSGVSATVALFDLTRRNVAATDPTSPLFLSYQIGEQQSKGIDVDVRWKSSPQLSWVAAFTHQTARVTSNTFNPALVDKRLFNVPERQLRIAARYDIRSGDLAGLGLGLGMTYRDRLPGDDANTFFTPAATVWDAQASYQRGTVRYALSVRNLLNKQYYQPSTYFLGGRVTPAAGRTVSLSAQFSF